MERRSEAFSGSKVHTHIFSVGGEGLTDLLKICPSGSSPGESLPSDGNETKHVDCWQLFESALWLKNVFTLN